jgi:hypothetical protein
VKVEGAAAQVAAIRAQTMPPLSTLRSETVMPLVVALGPPLTITVSLSGASSLELTAATW